MNSSGKNIFFGVLMVSPLLYVTSCAYISHARQAAFKVIKVGDTEKTVINKLGSAYRVEKSGGHPFLRYASRGCVDPCIERWWFENRMAFDTEAWSIEFGSDGRVLRKEEWSSP